LYTKVYFVPLVDVNWAEFAPLDQKKNFLIRKAPLEQCYKDIEELLTFFKEIVNGKCVLCVHTGTYCRTGFYEEPFLTLWRKAIELGGEIAVHTHEEIAGVGVRHGEQHLHEVINMAADLLRAGGIEPCGYRSGHFAFKEFITLILERAGLLMDFSAAPGYNQKLWDAVWIGAPLSAYYLCPINRSYKCCNSSPSQVLEIPLGTDNKGNQNINYLITEESKIDNMKLVWDSIVKRAEESGKPQFIHSLYHSSSMGIPENKKLFNQFVRYATKHAGVPVSPSEAKKIFESFKDKKISKKF